MKNLLKSFVGLFKRDKSKGKLRFIPYYLSLSDVKHALAAFEEKLKEGEEFNRSPFHCLCNYFDTYYAIHKSNEEISMSLFMQFLTENGYKEQEKAYIATPGLLEPRIEVLKSIIERWETYN